MTEIHALRDAYRRDKAALLTAMQATGASTRGIRVALRKLGSEAIAGNVARQAAALRDGIAAIDRDLGLFAEVRGRGLMLGAVLAPAHAGRAGAILDLAAAHGLLLLQAGPDVLRFVPALNITDDEVAEGLRRLRDALAAYAAG